MNSQDLLEFPSAADSVGITWYDATTGQIDGSMWGDENQVQANKERTTRPYIDGLYSPDTYYIVNGKPVLREPQKTRLDGMVLSLLPPNAIIRINEKEYTVNGSTVELEFDQPGSYRVVIESWPYLPKEFTIENQTQ